MEHPFDHQSCSRGVDCCILEDSSDFSQWSFPKSQPNRISLVESGSIDGSKSQGIKRARDQKRVQNPASSKACREKLRREKMNEMLSEIGSILHPDKPEKPDKCAVLLEAISAISRLRDEADELKQKKRKLQDDIINLKLEKAELNEDKLRLKMNKLKIEHQLNGGTAKLMGYSDYTGFPMWQWVSPTALDTSHDHTLRPPVA